MLPARPHNTEEFSARQKKRLAKRIACGAAAAVLAVSSAAVTYEGLCRLAVSAGAQDKHRQSASADVAILDKYDMKITNEIAGALDGVAKIDIERVYWLSDSDLVAPKPNPAKYGEADRPEELAWLIEEAADLLDGQTLLFGADTPVWEKDKIRYYFDETILVITWKQIIENSVFTISEVKIAHPSQFRRFLAGGEYGSDKQYITTEMAQSVNAVVAASGDFYKFRRSGAIVYDGRLQRFDDKTVDTCFIDENGDLLFSYRGELADEAAAQKFVEDNHVRFSLAFGPVLVDGGEVRQAPGYGLGEVNEEYTRAALCQMGELHYLLTNACGEPPYAKRLTIKAFSEAVAAFGCQKAYALDGGQTTVIAMDGKLISRPDFGWQRQISDIIYFATALPDGE